jgi:transcriptional regulator with XRE-family HTH domain
MNVDQELQRRRIIERRTEIGMSQRDVADFGALSQTSLSRIEMGLKVATVPELVGIAHATGSSVGYLTGQSQLAMKIAARASDDADTTPVQNRLRYLLEMDALLDSVFE